MADATKKGTVLANSTVKERVKIHLSVIGKRLNQKQVDKNYQNVTLTTNEDTLLSDYISGAFAYLAGQFPDYLSVYNMNDTNNGIQFDFTRFNDAQNSAFEAAIKSYVLSYTIGAYLSMVYPDLAKKYQQEAASYLLSARNIVWTKDAPSTTTDAKSYSIDYLSAPTTSFK